MSGIPAVAYHRGHPSKMRPPILSTGLPAGDNPIDGRFRAPNLRVWGGNWVNQEKLESPCRHSQPYTTGDNYTQINPAVRLADNNKLKHRKRLEGDINGSTRRDRYDWRER